MGNVFFLFLILVIIASVESRIVPGSAEDDFYGDNSENVGDYDQFADSLRKSNDSTIPIEVDEVNATTANIENLREATDEESPDYDIKQRMDYLRIRKKQEWLNLLRSQILERLGLPSKPNITSPPVSDDERRRMVNLFEKMKSQGLESRKQTDYSEIVQSLHPTCSVPGNVDRDSWNDYSLTHLYYKIAWPRQHRSTHTVSTAKLRLFKWNLETAREHLIQNCWKMNDCSEEAKWIEELSNTGEQERLRISIFQYTRPLKKFRKPKKKLVDSRMVSADYEGWVEFNVKPSVREWQEESNKNLGFELVLEDALEMTHNPNVFFGKTNCSENKAGLGTPFPRYPDDNPSLDGTSDYSYAPIPLENDTVPTLDLRLVEIPEQQDEDPATADRSEVLARRRRRRNVRHPCKHENVSQCCAIQPIEVNMEDLGWDFIVKPARFSTAICTGVCHHSQLEYSSQQVKCIPHRTKSLKVFYINSEHEMEAKTIENLVVEECKCAT